MNVNGVSSAGLALVNREIQQSIAAARATAAARQQQSADTAARHAAAAAIISQQAANRAGTESAAHRTGRVDAYL